MAIEIFVPRLGWSMENGTFSAWLKKEGDLVQPGEALFTLESDKATQDVESIDQGILRIPPEAPKPGDLVQVGQRLGYLLAPGESAPWEKPSTSPAPAPAAPSPSKSGSAPIPQEISPAPTPAGLPQDPRLLPDPFATRSLRASLPAISPRAARVARDLGVDWTRVSGSGRTGRIRERDIRAAAMGAVSLASPGSSTAPAIAPGAESLSATRRTIADRMTTSLRNTAPVTLTAIGDVTLLVRLREQWKAAAASAQSIVPSYTDVLVKLCATALTRHPALAARWEGERLSRAGALHIGLAVDTDAGLLVPVIRDAGQLSLRDIAIRSRELIERARSRKLASLDLRGGVFTITTLGSFGIDAFSPIINYPECAILGVGQIRREPAAVGDQIVLRHRVTLSLTFDHRAMDGATAARFLQCLQAFVESPAAHLALEA